MRIVLILSAIGWLAAGEAALTAWQALPRELTWAEQQQIKAARPGAQVLEALPKYTPVDHALMRQALLLLIGAGLMWGVGQIALTLQRIEATSRAPLPVRPGEPPGPASGDEHPGRRPAAWQEVTKW